MAGTFKFELVTPERMALSQDATQVRVPGVEGEFTVLAGHAPVISALRPGVIEVSLAEGGETERIFVKGGFAEVGGDRVTVLAQVADKRLPAFPNVPTLKEAGFDIPNVPQVRGVVAPPAIPKENVAYWEDVFKKLTQTGSWKKFLADNQFEDGFQNAAELVKFYDEFTDRMRGILKEAGAKVVR